MSFLKKLFQSYHSTFYDNSFVSLETATFSGLKSQFTKCISDFNFSLIYQFDKSEFLQLNSTFLKNNFIFQNVIDNQNNNQNRMCLQIKQLMVRLNKVSTVGGSFSQAEMLFPALGGNCTVKYIKPAIKEVKSVVGVNYLVKIKEYFLGAELLFNKNELGINFGIKNQVKNREISVNVQQLTLISANYTNKIGNISYYLDSNYNLVSKELNNSVLLQLQTSKSQINCLLNSNLLLKTTVEEKLNDNLTFNLSTECDLKNKGVQVGVGMSLDL